MATSVIEPTTRYRMPLDELKRLENLEAESPSLAMAELGRLEKTYYAAWGESVLWLRNQDNYKEKRIADDAAERMERVRRARAQKKPALPDPKPKPAAARLPREQRAVTWGKLDKIMVGVGDFVRAQMNAASGRFADAERVAELQIRCVEMESRLASYEKRAAAHDSALSGHRKHLSNLEIKYNDIRRQFAGEPPSGERIQQ